MAPLLSLKIQRPPSVGSARADVHVPSQTATPGIPLRGRKPAIAAVGPGPGTGTTESAARTVCMAQIWNAPSAFMACQREAGGDVRPTPDRRGVL